MLFSDNFSKNITNLYLFYYLTSSNNNILAFPVIITIAFSFFYDFYLVILILAGLTPNNKIDSFLRLAFSLSLSLCVCVCVCLSVSFYHCLLSQMTVTVPLYGSAISRDILYLLYYYTPPPLPPLVSPRRFFLGCSPRYANLPLYHISLAYEAERRRGRQEVVVEVDRSALRPPRTPTKARIQAVSGEQVDTSGSNRCLRGYRYSSKTGEDLSLRRKFYGILFKL